MLIYISNYHSSRVPEKLCKVEELEIEATSCEVSLSRYMMMERNELP
jgi:hypothetical protein